MLLMYTLALILKAQRAKLAQREERKGHMGIYEHLYLKELSLTAVSTCFRPLSRYIKELRGERYLARFCE